jgi:hypothetical protein
MESLSLSLIILERIAHMGLIDDNRPIYSDETETVVFRLKDFKQVVETHTQLKVTDFFVLDKSRFPEDYAQQPEMQPERAWFFQATFETPEGDKEDEVVVGLKDNMLRVYSHVRPILKVFKEKNREQAKEDIPDLTYDYIRQLERAANRAWLVWKEVYDTLHNVPSSTRLTDVKDEFQKFLDYFYEEFEKVGFLLPDSNLSYQEK